MPRIYAQNESHTIDFGVVDFVKGVAAVPAGADVSYFNDAGRHYIVDGSKHKLELWDGMTVSQLDELFTYLGGTPSAADCKYVKVRMIEGALSDMLLGRMDAVSGAGTAPGDTHIMIYGDMPETVRFFAKTGKTQAPWLLYGDVPDDTWTELTLTAMTGGAS